MTKTAISLSALMISLQAHGASITVLPERMITAPEHFSYSVRRNCCPSRYSVMRWGPRGKRCEIRRHRRGGAGGGEWVGSGFAEGGGGGGGGIGVSFGGVPTGAVSGSMGGGGGGGGGGPPGTPTTELVPPSPIPGPMVGEDWWSLVLLIAGYVAVRRRRMRYE